MRTVEWLQLFKEHRDVKIFHFNYLKLLTNISPHTLRISLSRLTQKNLVKRISRGFYANPFNTPTLKEIAGRIYQPSYISLEFVLSEEGILSQIPQVLTCVTPRSPRVFKTFLGTIIYRQIKKELFWGFEIMDGFAVAEKEKALLDWLYWHKKRYGIFPSMDELDFTALNREKLLKFSLKFPEEIRTYLEKSL